MGVLALEAAVLTLDGAAENACGIIGADMGRSLACGAWVGRGRGRGGLTVQLLQLARGEALTSFAKKESKLA